MKYTAIVILFAMVVVILFGLLFGCATNKKENQRVIKISVTPTCPLK